jgi:phospholipid/cholesterol/gamma-HCH transport system permease protein
MSASTIPEPQPGAPPPAESVPFPRPTAGSPLESFGWMLKFFWRTLTGITSGRVLRFVGEVIRQAGRLITSSLLVIIGLCVALGLETGVEGAYAAHTVGAAPVTGAASALGDLREAAPLAFGIMMAAKVSTGYVAEIGAMRISEEIDALDVMGLDSLVFLGCTRLLGMWLVIPFVFGISIASAFLASYYAAVIQLGVVSSGGFLKIFWEFQTPADYLYAGIKAMAMATWVVLVGCYYGYNAGGGPVGVGAATARAMAANILGVIAISMLGTALFWGGNPGLPIGG